MRKLSNWWRWRGRLDADPAAARCWRLVRRSPAFRDVRGTWELSDIHAMRGAEVLEIPLPTDPELRAQAEALRATLEPDQLYHFVAVLTSDTVGLDRYPLAQGRGWSFVVRLDSDAVVSSSSGPWFAYGNVAA